MTRMKARSQPSIGSSETSSIQRRTSYTCIIYENRPPDSYPAFGKDIVLARRFRNIPLHSKIITLFSCPLKSQIKRFKPYNSNHVVAVKWSAFLPINGGFDHWQWWFLFFILVHCCLVHYKVFTQWTGFGI